METHPPAASPSPLVVRDPIGLSCHRCGAHDRLWSVTAVPPEGAPTYWDARLCEICARGVLSDAARGAPYHDPVTVVFTLLDGP